MSLRHPFLRALKSSYKIKHARELVLTAILQHQKIADTHVLQVRVSKHLAEQEQIFFGTSLAYDKVLFLLSSHTSLPALTSLNGQRFHPHPICFLQ